MELDGIPDQVSGKATPVERRQPSALAMDRELPWHGFLVKCDLQLSRTRPGLHRKSVRGEFLAARAHTRVG